MGISIPSIVHSWPRIGFFSPLAESDGQTHLGGCEWLLGIYRERPSGCRAAQQRLEVPPSQMNKDHWSLMGRGRRPQENNQFPTFSQRLTKVVGSRAVVRMSVAPSGADVR
jgi:hypothetical protein